MEESILTSIKKLIGLTEEDISFDLDVTIAINTAIETLKQIGVQGTDSFSVTSSDERWEDYLPNQNEVLSMIKNFIAIKVKILVDPPQSSILKETLDAQIHELTVRINVALDNSKRE